LRRWHARFTLAQRLLNAPTFRRFHPPSPLDIS
jgi:hypothetical protein